MNEQASEAAIPASCPWCDAERGELQPVDWTSTICERHAREMVASAHERKRKGKAA